MSYNPTAFTPSNTLVHRLDARVKIVLVIAFSVSLFMVRSWTGLGLCSLLLVVSMTASRLNALRCARQLLPLGLILAFTLLANSFSFDVTSRIAPIGVGAVSPGFFQNLQPVAFAGSFGFVPEGFGRGCFYVLRIVLLVYASLVLVTTTSNSELARAIAQFLSPLGRFGFPVHDVATTVSIALRFIPVTIDEFHSVKTAQAARGAPFDSGSLIQRIKAWQTVLIPMFVGLFRRADRLAAAMDARCYGMSKATSLHQGGMGASSVVVLVCGLALCAVLSIAF